MRLLRAATLTTPDPDAALAFYGEWLGYEPVESGVIDAALAASWGTPAMTGRRYTVGRPASGTAVYLRFVEGEPVADYRPLRSYGWAAIELCVADTLAVHEKLKSSPFEIIGPPRQLDGAADILPMQVKGPSGEIVYLTEIRSDPPDCELPRAQSPVDQLFIAVLACSDMPQSMAWFERNLGIAGGTPVAITYTMLAKSFGLPIEQKHTIAVGLHQRDCFLEFDQYPPAATARPSRPGELKPGVALTSLWCPEFDKIAGDWIQPPRQHDSVIYGGNRAGTLRAPDDTIVEVIEVPDAR